jgi:hypothetical protein
MTEAAVTPTRRTPRRTSTWLWLLLISAGLALLLVIPIAAWLFQQDLPPFTVIVGGSETHQVHLGALSVGQRVAVLAGLFTAMVAVLIAVPLVLVLACVTLLVSVVLGIGLPLILVAAILLVVLSPLWLLIALARSVWRASAARPPPSGAAAKG